MLITMFILSFAGLVMFFFFTGKAFGNIGGYIVATRGLVDVVRQD